MKIDFGCLNIFRKYNESQAKKKRKETLDKTGEMFQLCEHNAELWLTHNGGLVCPCSMLKNDPVTSVRVMREMYISNSLNGEEI